jgi:hypothetical protein
MIYNSEDVFAADKYPEMAKELKMLKDAAGKSPFILKVKLLFHI